MLIERPALIQRIRPYYGDGLIKVITGLRRSGKSTLLKLIKSDLMQFKGLAEECFVELNFEDFSLHELSDARALHEYVLKRKAKVKSPLVLLLDEIQNVNNWEQCINSLRVQNIGEIFITGSNSKLLSSELATALAGRTIEFKVFPFSFKEFCAYKQKFCESFNKQELFQEYLIRGGMPGVQQYQDLDAVYPYLRDTFDSIVIKDVVQRYNIRQVAVLDLSLIHI